MRILLDMDEVLCDFVGGVCTKWGDGVDKDELLKYWEPGVWDIAPPLTKYLGRCPTTNPITETEFWNKINGDTHFWAKLKPLPWLQDLLITIQLVTGDWYVVTSPSRCLTSHVGKHLWITEHLPTVFSDQRLIITKHKHLFANYNTMLIDDRDSNVEEFRLAGGMGLVFPRHHNSNHAYKDDPVSYISKYIGASRLSRASLNSLNNKQLGERFLSVEDKE